jgi:hypothetical protein
MTDTEITLLGQQIAKALAPSILEMRQRALLSMLKQISIDPMDRPVTRAQLMRFIQQRGGQQPNGESHDFL